VHLCLLFVALLSIYTTLSLIHLVSPDSLLASLSSLPCLASPDSSILILSILSSFTPSFPISSTIRLVSPDDAPIFSQV